MQTDSAVAQAIQRLGGITKAIIATGFSEATWRRWRRECRIPDSRACFLISELTGISARELAGLAVIDGGPNGGERTSADQMEAVVSPRRSSEVPADHVSPSACLTRVVMHGSKRA